MKFELIKKWNTHYELKEAGYNLKNILTICNHSGTQRTYKDSIWAYDGYDFSDGFFGPYDEYKKNRHKYRKVIMKETKDGNAIKIFDSIVDASLYLGKSKRFASNIQQSIVNNHRSAGYYWDYYD